MLICNLAVRVYLDFYGRPPAYVVMIVGDCFVICGIVVSIQQATNNIIYYLYTHI